MLFGCLARFAAPLLAATALAGPLTAQCPDGSPPPCDVPARRTAPRVQAPPEAQRQRSFLLLPFRNLTRSTQDEWLVEGSPAMLADALGQWREVIIVPVERLYPALRRHSLAPGSVMDEARVRQVAEETGGWTAVIGDFLATGGRIRVSARAYDVVSNRLIVQAVEQVQAGEDVRSAYERLASKLLQRAGLTGSALNIAGVTTQSLDAYQAYLRGLAHTNRSEFREARRAFDEAIRHDSTFALAYARLAEASIVDLEAFQNPRSPAYAFAERAAALADRLSPRDRRLVRVSNAVYQGQFGAARAELEQLVAADSNDVEALEWLAALEFMDSIVLTENGRERRRGSLSASARLAKRVLSLEPARHHYYTIFAYSYASPAGYLGGILPGYLREAGSLREMFSRFPDRMYVAVLRDTIELVPVFGMIGAPTLNADSLRAARERALPIARAWVDRWLAVGPTEAEAHLWSARINELEGRFDDALRAVARAESLGVQSGFDDPRARRMILLGRLGRLDEAARLADSLDRARFFDGLGLIAVPQSYDAVGWGMHLLMVRGDLARASRLLDQFLSNAPTPPVASLAQLLFCGQLASPITVITLSDAVRVEAARGALRNAEQLPATGSMPSCLPTLLGALLRENRSDSPSPPSPPSPPTRARLAADAADAALRLAAAGRHEPAFELAALAAADSAQARRLAGVDWYQSRTRAQREAQLAAQRRFHPSGATVADEEATFDWRVEGAEAFAWNRAESRADELEYGWEVEFAALGSRFAVTVHQHKAGGSSARSGPAAQLANTAGERQVVAIQEAAQVLLPTALVLVRPTPDGFRIVLRNPQLVAALRRERPATVRVRFRPCIEDAGTKCVDEQIRVVYP